MKVIHFVFLVVGLSVEVVAADARPPIGMKANEELREAWARYFRDVQPPQAQAGKELTTVRELLLEYQRAHPGAKTPTSLNPELFLSPPKRLSLAKQSSTPFVQPHEKLSVNGHLHVTLEVGYKTTKIGNDDVKLRLYNGALTGPTLICQPGDTLHIKLVNSLPKESGDPRHNSFHEFNTTNLHLHGMHVSPKGSADNVFVDVRPGETFEYVVDVRKDHPCGLYWYHAHRHGSVAAQTSSGMAGAIIVKGEADHLPELRAIQETEKVMVLQQIPYDDKEVGEVELADAAKLFGPGAWDALGRFTTINGTILPLLRMAPGELCRWRLVNAGFREPMRLRLISSPSPSATAAPSELLFHEIATDGISLGRAKATTKLELWPGYRSEILVHAPPEPGEYLLVDDRVPSPGNGGDTSRKYVARLIVEGQANPMRRPQDKDLAPFRPKSIDLSEVTGFQEATYTMDVVNDLPSFLIDGHPFDLRRTRVLPYGATEEWTVRTINRVDGVISTKPVHHPFHIHTNSFEVISIRDEQGRETLVDDSGNLEPVWRDTVIVKNGHTVKFRTKYLDFDGAFVQHCHTLDHEDLGMMERVMIQKPDAPDARATESVKRLKSFQGQPLLVLTAQSINCGPCRDQIHAIAKLARKDKAWPRTIVVAPDTTEEVTAFARTAAIQPLEILADEKSAILQELIPGSVPGEHAAILLDSNGRVLWSDTTSEPLQGGEIRQRILAAALAPAKKTETRKPVPSRMEVALEIRNTAAGVDDYVTWAPAPCQARLMKRSEEDVTVTLTNDAERLDEQPHLLPPGGDVLFARTVNTGETAELLSVTLVLPKDGSPVPFVIAGRFGHPSSRDKDCLIEVHRGQAGGPVIGRQALMVRVRKNAEKLDARERQNLLRGLHRLDYGFPASPYRERFVDMHILASGRGKMNPWPDQAHKGSGFPPWHRAYGLELERRLQELDPSVTLPYWRMDSPSGIFNVDYMGGNDVSGEIEEMVHFSPHNPLFGWSATLRNPMPPQLLKRGGRDHALLPTTLPTATVPGKPFQTEDEILAKATYREFRASFEPNPHNIGHMWLGGRWSHGCLFPAADPIFWLFHCEMDRLWAKWQWAYGKFDSSGQDVDSYWPVGNFLPEGDVVMGHYLNDTMWPWDGTHGFQIENKENSRRPEPNNFGKFPVAAHEYRWPKTPSSPTPGDMIDYMGQIDPEMDLGFCFDDVPYGRKKAPQTKPLRASESLIRSSLLRTLRDATAPDDEKLNAAREIPIAMNVTAVDEMLAVARDPTIPSRVRATSISRLPTLGDPRAAGLALEFADKAQPLEVRREGVRWLSYLMDFGIEPREAMSKVEIGLEAACEDEDPAIYRECLIDQLRRGSPSAFVTLETLLEKQVSGSPGPFPLSITETIKFSAAVRTEKTVAMLRLLLRHKVDKVVAEAAMALIGESSSITERLSLLGTRTAPLVAREGSLMSLLREGHGFAGQALKIALDASEPISFREKALAGLRVAIENQSTGMDEPEVRSAIKQLRSLAASTRAQRLKEVIVSNIQLLEDEKVLPKKTAAKTAAAPDAPASPTFQDVRAILDRLVLGKTAYLQDLHGESFRWNSREALLAAEVAVPSGVYRLIEPDRLGNGRGAETSLVKSLRDPSGVDGNGQMPFEGNINGEYATDAEITTIITWIDNGCPE